MKALRWLTVLLALVGGLWCSGALALEPVVVVGDSLTAALDQRRARHTWESRVAHRLQWRVYALARGLQTAAPASNGTYTQAGAANTYAPALADLNYDRIVVLLGTNDYRASVSLEAFRDAYQSLLTVKPRATVCVIPPPVENEVANDAGYTLDDYRAVIREVCAGGVVVETQESLPVGERYFYDGTHLTRRGHPRLARVVISAIKESEE